MSDSYFVNGKKKTYATLMSSPDHTALLYLNHFILSAMVNRTLTNTHVNNLSTIFQVMLLAGHMENVCMLDALPGTNSCGIVQLPQ